MSNIYVTEPPTSGKIVLVTSKGDIEIELWAKECPLACRNIIALALEGYYDNQIWHRIVPGFCIQTGDPTGTGTGGESFYGGPFKDEVHQRLKFNRRGLVAMANPGELNMNESQFFVTLDACPELQNKHTLFGRISGPTIYNLLALTEVEMSESEPDRPLYPPKLVTIKVVENPFDDIVPRITREEKLAQEANKRKARAEAAKRPKEKVKKNTGLLSFGEAEEAEESSRFKGPISSHDLLKNDKRLRKEAAQSSSSIRPPSPIAVAAPVAIEAPIPNETKKDKGKKKNQATEEPLDLSRIREEHEKANGGPSSASDEIRQLEESIRGLSKRRAGGDEEATAAQKKARKGKDLLEEARRKYKSAADGSGSSKKASSREQETMDLLKKFQSSGTRRKDKGRDDRGSREHRSRSSAKVEEEDADETEAGMREYGASDEEEGSSDPNAWRAHRLDAGGVPINQDGHAYDSYVTLDPRDTGSSAAAALGFGSAEARKSAKDEQWKKQGRQGRDFVDETRREKESRGSRRGDDDAQRRLDKDELRPRNLERW